MSYTIFASGRNCTIKLEWDDEGDLRIYHKPEESEVQDAVVPKEKKGFFPFRSKNIKVKDFESLDKELEKEEKRPVGRPKKHDYW